MTKRCTNRHSLLYFLLCPAIGIVTNPSVCVSLREHISGTAGLIGTRFCVQVPCGRVSLLLWQHSATLCTSGFMREVTFGHNGRDAEMWRLHVAVTSVNVKAIPRHSLMSVYVCLLYGLSKCHGDAGTESDVYLCLFTLWAVQMSQRCRHRV